ncbi:hypothetical protein CHS0354_002945 [Potamilus streckersoni]|uniref:Uncharacterized protein n=1 Tax=Potamilus streckersoni TaxID=2493646 RepID=A0AAE0VJ02_9BIVA|nr:hypothetical protein CHS0354_002945 [Potamilus streckersoni]
MERDYILEYTDPGIDGWEREKHIPKLLLILSGGPYKGKTTTAAAVLLHTSTPQKCLVKHVDPLSFDVIFIDNMFGEININIEWVNKWMPYLEDMWSLHIFETCKPRLKRAELFRPEFCHRLSSVDMSDEEKAKILEQYLLGRNRLLTKDFIYECVQNYYGLLGFPACAELFATSDYLYLERGSESVLDSLSVDWVNTRSLEKFYMNHSVRGGFITYSEVNGSFDFCHAVVKDIVGMIMMRHYTKVALQECKFEFILEYLCASEQANDELKYRLEHDILKDTTFISAFVKRVKETGKLDIFGISSRLSLRIFYGCEQDDEIRDIVNVHFAEMIMHLGVLDEVSNKEFIASQKTIALLFGLRSRKLPVVKQIIQSGTVVNNNSLCVAVYQDYFYIVKIFIEEIKVDINGKAERMNNNTALSIAAKTGNRDMVMYLIKHGASINVTDIYNVSPLGRAIMYMHEDIAEILIDHGADVSLKMSRLQKTPLYLSAGKGMRNVVQVLLENGGANINIMDCNNFAPLGISIVNMHKDIAKTLIKHGADVFMKMGKLEKTPLHLASGKGMDDIVKVLLEKGASTDKRDRRVNTPLHCASINGHACIVNILLQHDISQVGKRNRRGQTPLHCASMNGNVCIVDNMIKHDRSHVNKRAFCNTKKGMKGSDVRGVTALHYAARLEQTDVADIVLQAGGESQTFQGEQGSSDHSSLSAGVPKFEFA